MPLSVLQTRHLYRSGSMCHLLVLGRTKDLWDWRTLAPPVTWTLCYSRYNIWLWWLLKCVSSCCLEEYEAQVQEIEMSVYYVSCICARRCNSVVLQSCANWQDCFGESHPCNSLLTDLRCWSGRLWFCSNVWELKFTWFLILCVHTHVQAHMCIYVCVLMWVCILCVCVCVWVCACVWERECESVCVGLEKKEVCVYHWV